MLYLTVVNQKEKNMTQTEQRTPVSHRIEAQSSADSMTFTPESYQPDVHDQVLDDLLAPPQTERPSPDSLIDSFQTRNPDFMEKTATILNPRNPSNKDSGKVTLGLTAVAFATIANLVTAGGAGQDDSDKQQVDNRSVVSVNSNKILPDLGDPTSTVIEIENLVSTTREQLTQQQLGWIEPQVTHEIKDNLTTMIPYYKKAEEVTGLNWKLLAGAHYRENNNDPRYSLFAGELLGTENPDFGDIKPADIEKNVIAAAKLYLSNAMDFYGIDASLPMTDEEIKYSLLAYNRGHIYADQDASPELSAYVMNLFNSPNFMRWSNDINLENHSRRGEIDRKIGAYPFYLYVTFLENNAFADLPGFTLHA